VALETERKFLLKNDSWKAAVTGSVIIAQGFLSKDPERTVRVRIAGDKAFLTIKGKPPEDRPLDTPEFEYPIPVKDAEVLLKQCLPGGISKTRHYIPAGHHIWEIDVFQGENAGLVVAEIELASAEEDFKKPDWLGEEVTFDMRYKNAPLSDEPYSSWPENAAAGKPPSVF